MGLLDEVRDDSNTSRTRRVDQIAQRLPEEDRQQFYEALSDRDVTSVAICRALSRRGIDVTEEQMRGYRRRIGYVVR